MRFPWHTRACIVIAVLALSAPARGDDFVRFFFGQPVGQEISVTGGFRRFDNKRQFYQRNTKTGDVQYFDYYGISMVPTEIVGNGTLSLPASLQDTMVLLYTDEELVRDIPRQGQTLWFTGTLIGYQHGGSGITETPGIGGDPYILLKSISDRSPQPSPVEAQSDAAPQ